MGAYNSLHVVYPCSACGHPNQKELQFKYGSCRLFEYKLGDKIVWDAGNNKGGREVKGWCAIEGYDGEPCLKCGHFNEVLLIYILDGLIVGVGDDLFGDNGYAVHPMSSISLDAIKVRLQGVFPDKSDPVGGLVPERRAEAEQ